MNAPYKIFHSLILASIFLLPCACQSPAPTPPPTDTTVPITELPQGTTIIRNGTIIDGRSPNPIPSGLVAFQDGLIIAVDGGVDELAHSIPFGHLPDALMEQMVEQDVAILPTLLALDLSLSRLDFSAEQEQRLDEQWQDNVRRYKAAGGQIALGSDYGVQGVPAGMPVDEMALMVDFGLTTMEVIQASTSTAAAMLGLEDQLGTLETGKQADIIVVDGDPLADIQSMANVIVVIKNGQPILLP